MTITDNSSAEKYLNISSSYLINGVFAVPEIFCQQTTDEKKKTKHTKLKRKLENEGKKRKKCSANSIIASMELPDLFSFL